MGYEGGQPDLDRAQLEQARKALKPLLRRFAREMRTSGKEIAVDFLCNGLEAIPVPILNVALAKSVRRMLQDSPGRPAADPQELLAILEEMQRSNEAFERGLELLRVDLSRIAADVREVKEMVTDQREPRLQLLSVETEENWPISDNRVSGLLANVGGGSVVVDELIVHVESWEPELRVDYSIPAAPLFELYLQAELNTSEADYRLFQLNGVSSRIFNERGAGADRVVIDLSSAENVRYALRLEAPFLEMTTGTRGSLLWPAADEPPLMLPFRCGPGWQEIDVSKLHAADAIYRDMSEKFVGLAAALATCTADAYHPELESRLESLGVPSYVVHPHLFTSFLRRFLPLFAQIAPAEGRERALAIVAALLTAAPEESLELATDDTLPRAILSLACGTPHEQPATDFASRLGDPAARAALGARLIRDL